MFFLKVVFVCITFIHILDMQKFAFMYQCISMHIHPSGERPVHVRTFEQFVYELSQHTVALLV